MEAHDADITRISAAVTAFHTRNEPFRIFHGSTNSTRPPHNQPVVDISSLDRILSVSRSARTIVVEPNVPMDRLVDATLAMGLVPPVVMEFPGITVGGGYAGSAGESSSFRHGGFEQTVTAVEMILATGEVVTASASERGDLFRGASGALGTLGIVTKLEMKLVEAGEYVRLSYDVFPSVEETVTSIKAATTTLKKSKEGEQDTLKYDFIEGILFSASEGVVITGTMTDSVPQGINPQTFSKSKDPWFYLHVKSRSASVSAATTKSKGQPGTQKPVEEDYVPIRDYLFRYDRGGFWMGERAFDYFRPFVPFTNLTRRILNPLMNTRALYRAGLGGGSRMTFRYIVHDLSLPYGTVTSFIDYVARDLDIWPLWLCPLPAINGPTFHPFVGPISNGGEKATTNVSEESTETETETETAARNQNPQPEPMLNVGVWGKGPPSLDPFIQANRTLESKLRDLGGKKVLYSHAYYTEDEFWGIYDKGWYEGLRGQYGAGSLPTVYDKVVVDVEEERSRKGFRERMAVSWPWAGVIGVLSALR